MPTGCYPETSSGYQYPGRYSRWDNASVRPPLEIVASGRYIEFRALNTRGEMLCQMLQPLFENHPHFDTLELRGAVLAGKLKPLPALFSEEERRNQLSVFHRVSIGQATLLENGVHVIAEQADVIAAVPARRTLP